jgi:hypothetical protein
MKLSSSNRYTYVPDAVSTISNVESTPGVRSQVATTWTVQLFSWMPVVSIHSPSAEDSVAATPSTMTSSTNHPVSR